jgi:trehalose 6-phosphate phosphatase
MPVALFLDFDGTLVDFADHPDAVQLAPGTRAGLAMLHEACNGAFAIVSGREIESVDRLLNMPSLAVAGAHGLTRRKPDGTVETASTNGEVVEGIAARLEHFAAPHRGLLVERKMHSVALHFRRAPHMQDEATAAMRSIVSELDAFHMMEGKMLVEARSIEAGKGAAIAGFMAEPPFAGRMPLFVGDDVTDEDGFETVNAAGGITIKIGPGDSTAQYRLADPAAFRAWLGQLSPAFASQATEDSKA